jgi:hypothetical protein
MLNIPMNSAAARCPSEYSVMMWWIEGPVSAANRGTRGCGYPAADLRHKTHHRARPVDGMDVVTGACEHCDWRYIGGGYPETVKAYQDHLRAEHPQAWLRR